MRVGVLAGDRDKAIEDTMVAVTSAVRDEYRAGRMPSGFAIFWRQLTGELPKFVKGLVPALVSMPTDMRLALSFFGTFFLIGFWDGFVQSRQLVRNALISAGNVRAGRAWSAGTKAVQLDSAIDALKVLLFVGTAIALGVGIVVIAGGGAFGSAGSTLRW